MSKKVCVFAMCILCFACFCGFSPSFGVDTPAEESGIRLPIVMYHSLSTTRSGDYIVPVRAFENDIRAITEAGFTTVTCAEVWGYLEGKNPLPAKPIMIVFDDGHYNNILYGEPILKKYGARAVINIVGKFIDRTEEIIDQFHAPTSTVTWEHVRNIDRNVWEVGSHTYDMHRYRPRFGVGHRKGENDESYRSALRADNDIMVEKLRAAGVDTNIFAFPFGKVTGTSKQVFAEAGYKIMFSCLEKVNVLPEAGNTPPYIMLGRFNRRAAYSTDTILSKLQK